jgi:hypothetical protein
MVEGVSGENNILMLPNSIIVFYQRWMTHHLLSGRNPIRCFFGGSSGFIDCLIALNKARICSSLEKEHKIVQCG